MKNATAVSPAALPVVDGFRQRGLEMTRLETFTDAAFAFVVTLLVVGGGDSIPQSFAELKTAMIQVPAFAASFANIMLFWYAHHIWSRRYGMDDSRAVILSLLLIFVVLIFVYPLKAVFSGALHFFSGGFLTSYFAIATMDELRLLFVIYGAGFAGMSLAIALLYRAALREADTLDLDDYERYTTAAVIQHWYINIAVPLYSILMALTLPDAWVPVAGMWYGVFGIVAPLHAWQHQRGAPAKSL